MDDIRVIQCSHIGISGTTDVHVQKIGKNQYEARIGIAMLGMTNMDDEGFKKCGSNPFHPDFNDNYASGKGTTESESIESMKQDMHDISNSIWAF